MPAVSLIVPVYNAEPYLPACLDSVLSQTFADYEVLMVDDGSTDQSLSVMRDYASRDSRFHAILSDRHQGPGDARNLGLQHAQGQYVAFVDADDVLEPQYLEALTDGLACDAPMSPDLVIHGFTRFIPDGSHSTSYPVPSDVVATCCTMQLSSLLFGTVCAKLFIRSVIEQHHIKFPEDVTLAEDQCFLLRYMMHCQYAHLQPLSHYHYVQRSAASLSISYFAYELELRSFNVLDQAWQALLVAYPDNEAFRSTYDYFISVYVHRMQLSIALHGPVSATLPAEALSHYRQHYHPMSLYTRCMRYSVLHHMPRLSLLLTRIAFRRYHMQLAKINH